MRQGYISLVLTLFCAFAISSASVKAQEVAAGAAISYTLQRDAFVTLNIMRPNGWVVRELLVDEKQSAGPHRVVWDGRDNNGRLLPVGAYQWRLLQHQGIAWNYVTSIGNGGTPPWQTADGTGGWGANHGNPTSVATDATGAYLGWSSAEGPYALLKRSHDGAKGVWGKANFGAFGGVYNLATDGQFLYGAKPTQLWKIDPVTGNQLASVPLNTKKRADDQEPLVIPPGSVSFGFFREDQGGMIWGMAAAGGRVYISCPYANTIAVYEAEKLQAKPDENLPVHRPRGIVCDGQGHLLVVSDNKVLSIDVKTKAVTPVISTGLEAAFALARAADGTLFVSEMGSVQQIKKFSADGRLLATFGRRGGGTDFTTGGQFQPQDFRQPCALAVNPDGSVWVVEDTIPKRIARISGTDGTVLFQGFGSINYAATIIPNPNDPSEVFSTMWGVFSARVDYEKKSWTMGRILPTKWGGDRMDISIDWAADKAFARNGKTYLWTGNGLLLVEADHLRPVMYLYTRLPEKGPLGDLAKARNAKARGWNTDVTIWSDRNGDVAVQPDEVQFVPLPGAKHGPQFFGHGGMLDDFSLVTYGYRWKPREFTADGVPLYVPEDIVFSEQYNGMALGLFDASSPAQDTQGNFYMIKNFGAGNGTGFWSGRCGDCKVISYGPDWKPRWGVGRHSPNTARSGEMYYLWKTDGVVKGCLFVTDVENLVHVVHQDGFYVQSLMQDGRKNPHPGPDLLNVENFSGSVFVHPQTKKTYLYISSSEAANVFEITGLDSITVGTPQKITLAAPQHSPATQAVRQKGQYMITRLPVTARVNEGLVRGGVNWTADIPAMVVQRDGKPAGEIRLVYDDKNLYVHADVLSDYPLRNSARRGETTFVEALDAGDTVEVLFGLDPDADVARTKAVEGDLRLIYTHWWPKDNGVVLMRGETRDGDPGTPYTYKGASGETTLADVRWLNGTKISIETPFQNNGYVLNMTIPWTEILPHGVSVKELLGERFRLDAGITWRAPYEKTAVKAFWTGKNPAMLLTSDPAAEAKLWPNGWGWAILDAQIPAEMDTIEIARTATPKTIDGATTDWTEAKPINILGTPGSVPPATAKLAYDAQNFYAVVRVTDTTPLKNGSATPEMIIKGGDAVAVTFGTVNGQGTEQKVAFTQVNGKPIVTLYRPKSLVKKPYEFRSPVSAVTFDYVASLPDARAVFKAYAEGYVAEIAIPWSALGYTAAPGLAIPFDLQVIFSDPAGSTNALTNWWHSRSPESACTVDLPTEAKLYPKDWGKLLLQ